MTVPGKSTNQLTKGLQLKAERYVQGAYELSQNKGGKVVPFVRHITQVEAIDWYSRRGQLEPKQMVEAAEATPHSELQYDKRGLTILTFHDSLLADIKDLSEATSDLKSDFAQELMHGFARTKDKVMLAAAFGEVYTMKRGADGVERTLSSVAFPDTQVYVPGEKATGNARNDSSAFTYEDLQKIKQVFRENNVDESEQLYILSPPKLTNQIENMEEYKNRDYRMGEIGTDRRDMFVLKDVLFIKTSTDILKKNEKAIKFDPATRRGSSSGTQTLAASGYWETMAWCKSGLLFATRPSEDLVKVSERDDRSHAHQIYWRKAFNGLRIEDVKVLKLPIKV